MAPPISCSAMARSLCRRATPLTRAPTGSESGARDPTGTANRAASATTPNQRVSKWRRNDMGYDPLGMTVGLTDNHQARGDWLLRQRPPAIARPSVRPLGNNLASLAGADTRPI